MKGRNFKDAPATQGQISALAGAIAVSIRATVLAINGMKSNDQTSYAVNLDRLIQLAEMIESIAETIDDGNNHDLG